MKQILKKTLIVHLKKSLNQYAIKVSHKKAINQNDL